jgi:hypothetical protein
VPAAFLGGKMTTQLLKPPIGAPVIKQIVELTTGVKVLQNDTVETDINSKIHIWQLSNKKILVITEVGKKMTGCDVRKGSYDAILGYFTARYENVTVH